MLAGEDYNRAPQAQNVKIYRQGEQTLAGSYVYYDEDRDPEGEDNGSLAGVRN